MKRLEDALHRLFHLPPEGIPDRVFATERNKISAQVRQRLAKLTGWARTGTGRIGGANCCDAIDAIGAGVWNGVFNKKPVAYGPFCRSIPEREDCERTEYTIGLDAFDFLLFCQRNPKPCPLLEVLEAGKYRTATGRKV